MFLDVSKNIIPNRSTPLLSISPPPKKRSFWSNLFFDPEQPRRCVLLGSERENRKLQLHHPAFVSVKVANICAKAPMPIAPVKSIISVALLARKVRLLPLRQGQCAWRASSQVSLPVSLLPVEVHFRALRSYRAFSHQLGRALCRVVYRRGRTPLAEIKKPPLLTPLSLFPVSHGDRCRQRRNEAGHSLIVCSKSNAAEKMPLVPKGNIGTDWS
jgi:hypothetical protein